MATTGKKVPRPTPVEEPVVEQAGWRLEDKPVVILESECAFAGDNSKATIILEHEAGVGPNVFDDLTSTDARNLAIAYASAAGVGDARQNGNVEGPFAVNEEGIPLEEVRGPGGKPYPPQHPKMQPHRYRVAVPVCRKLV